MKLLNVECAIADELGRFIGAEAPFVSRVDSPGGYRPADEEVPVGFRFPLVPGTVHAIALETGRSARLNGDELANGPYGAITGDR